MLVRVRDAMNIQKPRRNQRPRARRRRGRPLAKQLHIDETFCGWSDIWLDLHSRGWSIEEYRYLMLRLGLVGGNIQFSSIRYDHCT